MARDPIPTHSFVMLIVRLGRRFLVIRERKHGQGWYVPAGRIEPGETVAAAARREALEEAGIDIVPEGLVRIEQTPYGGYNRQRFWLLGHPADDRQPGPTEDSLDARFVTLEDMAALDLRGPEALEACRYIAQGGASVPLSLIQPEGAPWARTR